MKRKIKHILCGLLYFTGITPLFFWILFQIQKRVLVLLYHHIREPENLFEPVVAPAEFEKQILFLKKHFDLISVSDLLAKMENENAGKRPLACVTFDDGYRNNLENAYPLLKRHEVPAVLFLATGCIGTGERLWTSNVDRIFKKMPSSQLVLESLSKKKIQILDSTRMQKAFELKRTMKEIPDAERKLILEELEAKAGIGEDEQMPESREMLNWEEVRVLASDPLIEIGSHTVTHRMLDHLNHEEVRAELVESKQVIEKETGRKIFSLAYPANHYDEKAKRLAYEVGYRCAFAVDHGLVFLNQDRFALKRIPVQNEPLFVLLAEITLVLPFLRSCAGGLCNRKPEISGSRQTIHAKEKT